MREQPRARDARLAGRGEDAGDGAVDGTLELGVLEDDVCGLAAELQDHRLQALRRGLIDAEAAGLPAGECHLCHLGMRRERQAGFRPETGHHVDHTGREPGLLEQLAELEDRGRGMLRGLHDHGAPGCECRCELPGREQQRRVPRSDRRDDPDGLTLREVEDSGLVRGRHRAFDLVGKPAEVIEPLRQVGELRTHLCDELAVVADLDRGEAQGLARHQIADAAQERTALRGREGRPGSAGEGGRGGLDRCVHIRAATARDQGPGTSRKRIERFEPVPRGGLDPAPADEHAIAREGLALSHRSLRRRRGRGPRRRWCPPRSA